MRRRTRTLLAIFSLLVAAAAASGQLAPWPQREAAVRVDSGLVVSLQAQVRVLQRELAGTEAGIKGPGEDWIPLVADSAPAGTPGTGEIQTQAETENAPEIKDDKLAAFIAALQAKIISLQRQLEQPEATAPAGPPVAGPPEISRPPIQDLTGKLHTHATNQYETRPRTAIQTLVIHHSAAPPTVGPQQIAAYHVNRLDWPGAGYHFLVSEDGIINQANSEETVSYHAAKVNPRGIGICFLGNFTNAAPPAAQVQAGAHLVAWLMGELDLPIESIKGHKKWATMI